ncbi:class I SAM-dependent DNA methyltransferase [Isoptericola aurantiacus]|uniref:class I SAM-dependent DNA methyltransferase n=1 Tax=Isoptericola aurantiacus TaxID=3377839 RepID=UPI00383BA39C
MAATHVQDRALVARWADERRGPLLDAGCGPGHWTAWLASRGNVIEGVDGAERFVEHARATWPEVPFRVAMLDSLGMPDGSLDGILAWYSLIHLPPAEIDGVLAEFARCLAEGGSLLLGLFDGADLSMFDHQVAPAFTWSVDGAVSRLEAAGFDVVGHRRRADPGTRHHLDLVARRR